jgi:hypothetical protein
MNQDIWFYTKRRGISRILRTKLASSMAATEQFLICWGVRPIDRPA